MKRVATAGIALLLALGGCDRAASRGTAGDGPSYLDAAFAPGYLAEVEGRRVTFEARRIGALKVTSGGIVACDPFLCDDAEPFVRPVPNGEFPLVLAVARLGPGHERVALARIAFSSEPVAAWEKAVTFAEESAPVSEEMAGYPVDSGTGAFMDAVAWTRYHAEMRGPEGAQRVASILTRMANEPWLLPGEEGGGIAFFRAGWGDGRYASYWGLDAAGDVAALVTDFQLVP